MSINDLLAFATGAPFTIESNAMVTIDERPRRPHRARASGRMAGRARLPRAEGAAAPVCRTEYYVNRAFAAVGRAAATALRSDLPADRGPVRGEHRRGAPGDRGGAWSRPSWPAALKIEAGSAALEMQRTYTTSDGEVAQVTVNTPSVGAVPPFDDHAPGQGRGVRVREGRRAACAPRPTAAGCGCATPSPIRFATPPRAPPIERVLVDGDIRLDCHRLARPRPAHWPTRCWRGCPPGSVVSFMLPNWHEAAVIYPAATLAGHGGQPGPALAARPRVARSSCPTPTVARSSYRPTSASTTTPPMLDRVGISTDVTARGRRGPRRRTPHLRTTRCSPPKTPRIGCPVLESRRRAHDPVHLRHHRSAEGRSAHA